MNNQIPYPNSEDVDSDFSIMQRTEINPGVEYRLIADGKRFRIQERKDGLYQWKQWPGVWTVPMWLVMFGQSNCLECVT